MVTQNADIQQNIQQNYDAEMQPGDQPIALEALQENDESQKHNFKGPNYLMESLMKIRDQAKKREAKRQLGPAQTKYGQVKSVVAKNKRII